MCHQITSLAFIYFTKSNFGQGSALFTLGSLQRSPDPLVGWGGGYPFPISIPLDAIGVNNLLGAFGTDWAAHFSDAFAAYRDEIK